MTESSQISEPSPQPSTENRDGRLLTGPTKGAEQRMGQIHGLLSGLIEDQHLNTKFPTADSASARPGTNIRFENDLALVRLGVATSLFLALRSKHPPTASHSLRAAVACSAWCERLQLDDAERDRIEVAALLHDIGKIGIPDSILKKPGKLSVEEQHTMDLCPQLGVEILSGSTTDQQMLDIIRLSHVWYESRRQEDRTDRVELPLGARMLSIVEAFDSMTTHHVYRSAMSRERALAELNRCAGTQFDPELASDYHRMLELHPEVVHGVTVNRWLNQLRQKDSDSRWRANPVEQTRATAIRSSAEAFFRQLMIHTYDGVAFIDHNGIVSAWNTSLHQLTGISPEAACGNKWEPELIGLRTTKNVPVGRSECPITNCLTRGGYTHHQFIAGTNDRQNVLVNVRVTGVVEKQFGVRGAVALFQDASQQATLEKRVRDLNERVTRDPLTGIANRAEFDRKLAELTGLARGGNSSFSLIMCDIDRFKHINDTYGHPAGDEAIIRFSQVINDQSRDGDLVARYGGEEFSLLCSACDNATAAKRAEAIRVSLEETVMSFLENKSITASFGVTEFQDGDTAETVLARADRALLRAKDNGRNRVIQLGSGGFNTTTKVEAESSGWFSWLERGADPEEQGNVRLTTPVPIDLVVEKIRGFVSDHNADILRVGANELEIRMTAVFQVGGRRKTDHRMDFHVKMQIDEQETQRQATSSRLVNGVETTVDVALKPVRIRDRRKSEVKEGTQQVVSSLRAYLMADIVR